MSLRTLFDLREQLAFYGSYHHHPVNKLVHITFVPIIMWAFVLLVSYYTGDVSPQLTQQLQSKIPLPLEVNGGLIVLVVYFLYYLSVEPFAALTLVPLFTTMTIAANYINANHANYVWTIFAACQFVGWTSQIASHKFAEGGSPALKENLVQALLLAPLFVWLEVLFAFGYRRELRKSIDALVAKRIALRKTKKIS